MKPKGYLIALVSTIALANVYIFSKAALRETDIGKFGVYWFGFALIWNFFYIVWNKKLGALKSIFGQKGRVVALIGLCELFATVFLFLAIDTIENPAIPSFLSNFGPIFVTILGFFVLHEKFNRIEFGGIILVILGAFIISYSGKISIAEIFIDGTWYAIASSFFFSLGSIISKKNIAQIEPIVLSINRVIYLLIVSITFVLVSGTGFTVNQSVILNTLIGSFLGPFLSAFFAYLALKYIEATRVSMILSTRGIFVLIGGWVYFDSLPENIQIIGGVITILGIIVLTSGRKIVVRTKSEKRRI